MNTTTNDTTTATIVVRRAKKTVMLPVVTDRLNEGFEQMSMPEHGKNGALPDPMELDPITLVPMKP